MKTFKSAYQAGRGYLDLFKEDEEVAEETEVVEVNGKQPDQEPETEDQSHETDDDLDEIEDVAGLHEEGVGLSTEELEPVEQEYQPKVSLRRRLELEQSS